MRKMVLFYLITAAPPVSAVCIFKECHCALNNAVIREHF